MRNEKSRRAVRYGELRYGNHCKLCGEINETERVGRTSPQAGDAPVHESYGTHHCSDISKSASPSYIPAYESAIRDNPPIPQDPKDFGSFDFTALEDKARNLWYSDDHWVANN